MPDKVVTKLASLPRPVTFKEAARTVQRVAAYARVSTDHEEQETSLAAQTDYYKRKIMEHPGWEFVQIYVDMYNQRLIQFKNSVTVRMTKSVKSIIVQI